MLSRFFFLLSLILVSSCSLFKSHDLHNKKLEDLVGYLKGTGEGKGRLGINQNQYLFGFDALLKENFEWVLAANIPLHGEEILILSDLRKESANDQVDQSLEFRIQRGIAEHLKAKGNSAELARAFLLELRRIMRLVLHKEIKEQVVCQENGCTLGQTNYAMEAKGQVLKIKKSLSENYEIEYVAQNLTDSIFRRGSIFLHSVNTKETLLSLELFWN